MKILNRPMFRMGGPIKEGIMNGIQEPRRIGYATKGTVSVADQAAAFENIFTTPQVTQEQVNMFAKKKGTPYSNMSTPKVDINSLPLEERIQIKLANSSPLIDSAGTEMEITGKGYIGNEPGIDKTTKEFFKGLTQKGQSEGYLESLKEVENLKNKKLNNDSVAVTGGKSPFAYTLDNVIKDKGKMDVTENTPLTKKERTNNILEMLGYDKAKKNALYDAMINAGQRISRTGLGADNLVSDIIQDTSTVYDKPEKLREAANLMDVQQQLKLDQIDASKDKRAPIQKTIEYYMSEDGGNLSRKDAMASAKNQPIEAFAIFQEAKSKGTTTEAVDYTASKMASDDKFGEGLRFINRIPTKLKGAEGLQKFIESDAYNGDGVYTRGGEILVIKNGKATNMITFKGTGETGIFGGEK